MHVHHFTQRTLRIPQDCEIRRYVHDEHAPLHMRDAPLHRTGDYRRALIIEPQRQDAGRVGANTPRRAIWDNVDAPRDDDGHPQCHVVFVGGILQEEEGCEGGARRAIHHSGFFRFH